MKEHVFPLGFLSVGKEGIVVQVKRGKGWRRRLLEMGIAEGAKVKVVQNVFPGPCVVALGNVRLMLGHGMANRIMVREVNRV